MSQTVQKTQSETNNSEKPEENPSWSELASKAWNNKASLVSKLGELESRNYKRFYRLNFILLLIVSLLSTIPLYLPLLLIVNSELFVRIYDPDSLVSRYFQTICNISHFHIFTALVLFSFVEYTLISILTVCLGLFYWRIKNDTGPIP